MLNLTVVVVRIRASMTGIILMIMLVMSLLLFFLLVRLLDESAR